MAFLPAVITLCKAGWIGLSVGFSPWAYLESHQYFSNASWQTLMLFCSHILQSQITVMFLFMYISCHIYRINFIVKNIDIQHLLFLKLYSAYSQIVFVTSTVFSNFNLNEKSHCCIFT